MVAKRTLLALARLERQNYIVSMCMSPCVSYLSSSTTDGWECFCPGHAPWPSSTILQCPSGCLVLCLIVYEPVPAAGFRSCPGSKYRGTWTCRSWTSERCFEWEQQLPPYQPRPPLGWKKAYVMGPWVEGDFSILDQGFFFGLWGRA